MEYRRRVRSRQRRGGRAGAGYRGTDGGSAVRVVLLLLVGATIIYMICGTSIGTIISKKVFAPLFMREANETTPSPIPTKAQDSIVNETPGFTTEYMGKTASAEVELPKIELYMLQMGVFSSMENAMEVQSSLAAMGAAGYAYDDNGSFRVIASAYLDEESANSVKSRLSSEGYDCTVYKVQESGVQLLITADEEKLLPIETAFALAYETVNQYFETVIDFDAQDRSVDYGISIISEMRTNAQNAAGAINEAAQENELLMQVYEYYRDVAEIFSGIMRESDYERTVFSSDLKKNSIIIALRYVEMLKGIGG